MAIFEPVTLKYKGQEYVIEANRVLKAIACVEEHITIGELSELQAKGNGIPLVKIACAFGAVLRFAGCKTSDEEAYEALFSDGEASAVNSVTSLLVMCIPPSVINAKLAQLSGQSQGNAAPSENASRRKPSKR